MQSRFTPLQAIYGATFFYAIHYAVTLYVESSFLGSFITPERIGIFFTVASLLSIIAYFNAAHLIRRFTNYNFLLGVSILEVLLLSLLAFANSVTLVLIAFTLHQVVLNLLFLSLTISLETYSRDESTGRNRGVFLTILNSAILIGPLIAGSGIAEGGYQAIFLAGAFLLMPMLFIVGSRFRSFREPLYDRISFTRGLQQLIAKKDIRGTVFIQFMLEFFYSIMVIYTPLYLVTVIGIPLATVLGVIFPIALLPFVIFPYFLGNISDTKLGEKELLATGFIIVSVSLFYLSFITTTSTFVWAFALFITRIGASCIEIMTETHFFKQIDATDTHLIAFFRTMRSFAYIVAPLLASAFLILFPYNYLFATLGIFMLLGFFQSINLRDSR